MEKKSKKIHYYICNWETNSYYGDYGWYDISSPTSHFRRFKSIKGAEKVIKTELQNDSNKLIIETTKQVRRRRRENLVLYYADLFKRIKKSFTKKEVKRILEGIA